MKELDNGHITIEQVRNFTGQSFKSSAILHTCTALHVRTITLRVEYTSPAVRDFRFGTKVGQIGNNWDKSGTFSDQISVQFGSASQNVLKYDIYKPLICPIWGRCDSFWALICRMSLHRIVSWFGVILQTSKPRLYFVV